ncbi:hypothetical protein [Brazilian marseillevirus]|uniref:hypothetical protein n=1 Tax=Brazilian marseillevirus TaxID=1813599 RepID=UPI00078412B7|nr:hypothetical protein A3303_gp305 [Brazilian marseillevirus]AMQ10813.1 hypothetical protein [Brazilian marseillevirus]
MFWKVLGFYLEFLKDFWSPETYSETLRESLKTKVFSLEKPTLGKGLAFWKTKVFLRRKKLERKWV